LGYDRQNIFLAWTAPGQSGRTGSELAELFPVVQDRIGLIPGVLSVGPSAYGLLAGSGGSPGFVDGHVAAPQEDIWIRWNLVAPRYFESMGMKLLLGRDLKEQDNESAPQVAVINQTMAHFYFGDANPVGKYFRLRRVTSPPIEIVGVVGDARGYDSLREQTPKMIFIPYRQDLKHLSVMCVAVRAVGDPIAMKTKIQGVLRSIDRNLPVLAITTMEEQLDGSLVQERLIAMLSGLFSGLTLLLACLGLYGLISHIVARKTNEIGIRMALGATRGSVLKMILTSSVWLVIAGVAVGVATALAITRLVSSQLFGIGAADPLTIAGASALMLLVSAVAALLPAYRASKVDPMVALRYE
jgi:predicted permease